MIQRLGKSMASGAPPNLRRFTSNNVSMRRKSYSFTDLKVLDKLVASLLERQQQQQHTSTTNQQVTHASAKLGRLKSLSLRDRRTSGNSTAAAAVAAATAAAASSKMSTVDTYGESEFRNDGSGAGSITRSSNIAAMPTILESGNIKRTSLTESAATTTAPSTTNNMSSGIRHVINSIKNAPHRFSHGEPASDSIQLVDEKQNILDWEMRIHVPNERNDLYNC